MAVSAVLRSSHSAMAVTSFSFGQTCCRNGQNFMSESVDRKIGGGAGQWLRLHNDQVAGSSPYQSAPGSARFLVTHGLSPLPYCLVPRRPLGSKKRVVLSFTLPGKQYGSDIDQTKCYCMGIVRRGAKRMLARAAAESGGAYVSHSQQQEEAEGDSGGGEGGEGGPVHQSEKSQLSSGRSQNGSSTLGWDRDMDGKDEFKGWLDDENEKGARRRITAKGIVLFAGSVLLAAGLAIASYTMYRRGARMPTPTVTAVDLQVHPGHPVVDVAPTTFASPIVDHTQSTLPSSPVESDIADQNSVALPREGAEGLEGAVDDDGALGKAQESMREMIVDLEESRGEPVAGDHQAGKVSQSGDPADVPETPDRTSTGAPVDAHWDGQDGQIDGVLSPDMSKSSSELSGSLSASALSAGAAEDADSEMSVVHRAGSAGGSLFSVPSASIVPPAMSTTAAIPDAPSPAESLPPSPVLERGPPRVVVPAVVDPIQGQAFEALQILKVIDLDAEAGGICTRREYARLLINASTILNRQREYRVLPAMFIEGLSTLAFDDVYPDDPDFPYIQGLAEAGIISSKLSREDLGCDREAEQLGCASSGTDFRPDDPLTREDLINWKMALENRNLPLPDKQMLRQNWGFIDTGKVSNDALPAVAKDLSLGRRSAITAAFGYTKRLEPHKPVTRAQAAAALATGELAEVVAEEVARLEADKIAAAAVQAAAVADALADSEAARRFAQDLKVERRAREELELGVTAAKEETERVKRDLEEAKQKVEEERLSVLAEKEEAESAKAAAVKAKEEAEGYLDEVLSSKKEVDSEKSWLQRETERVEAEREVFEKARAEADAERQLAAAARMEAEAEKRTLAAARALAESEARKAKEASRKLEALKKRLRKEGRTIVEGKDEVVEVPTITERNLDIGINLKENDPENAAPLSPEEIKRKVSETLERLDDRRSELVDSVMEHVGNAARTTGQRMSEARQATGDKVRGVVQSIGSTVSEAQRKLADGTKRIADECKDGVSKLAGRLKGA